jgi:hypothetical protein
VIGLALACRGKIAPLVAGETLVGGSAPTKVAWLRPEWQQMADIRFTNNLPNLYISETVGSGLLICALRLSYQSML